MRDADAYRVLGRHAHPFGKRSGQKVFAHAQRGAQRYEYATFQANDDPALKLAIYTPVSGDERD
ncbi:hypothetical protein L3V59_31485 [Burkholderia aenigmatica]|uniref:hypothetical protein n=1 Tax=Burkholderia aenigmatica TaxID=2015348 RepID=UPI001F1F0803|nr:hypothetical protein [Burkholderia aenigmatica]UKD14196.1 hypothetical protein L3V59_31485 [Burkholderia aenigmatica]